MELCASLTASSQVLLTWSRYRHIDTAYVYGVEASIGAALREVFAEGTVRREELFVTTKLFNTHHAKEDVEPACRRSLALLGLDYVDMYLMHWP